MMGMNKFEEAVADFKKAMQLDSASHEELNSLIIECNNNVKKGS
jgi:hypothetical protein